LLISLKALKVFTRTGAGDKVFVKKILINPKKEYLCSDKTYHKQ